MPQVSTGSTPEPIPLIAVAGASGFVGTHLRHALKDDYRFRALSRSEAVVNQRQSEAQTRWEHCDLYSLPKVTDALVGCQIGLYLVHSMAPSSRLLQARFEDTDLLLADNFVRAAEAVGIDHIVYLSGLMPRDPSRASPHLRSRFEVESVLRSRSVKVTVLRAGLIFGPGGSSFSMLINLVRRLPLMVLPKWAASMTQGIDIHDVCRAVSLVLKSPELQGDTYDIAGHDAVSYRNLIEETARHLKRRTVYVQLPVNAFGLSRQWVSLFGGVPPELVGPLLESLQHDLTAQPNRLLTQLQAEGTVSFTESLTRSVDKGGSPKPNPRRETRQADARSIYHERRVRSVQRMPLPHGLDAQNIASIYGSWITEKFKGLLRADRDETGTLRFHTFGGLLLLELTPTPTSRQHPFRCAFYITNGWLARKVDPPGRFEFRIFPSLHCVIASIHGFSPTLPWFLYARTQAIIHLWVMQAFSNHLKGKALSQSAEGRLP